MKSKFAYDYKRLTGQDYKFGLKAIINILGFHQIRYIYWLRSYEKSPSKLKRIILFKYARKFGLEISPAATIGKELYLGHPYNITVGAEVVIGEHVSLHKGCTIGRENRGKREGSPTIGDFVWIGINATIVGKISIGNDVLISPNSFVNCDVPDHSVVFGNPAVIRHKLHATEGYL